MFRSAKNKFDFVEMVRRAKRLADGGFLTYRKLFVVLLGVCVFFYMLPPIFRYLFFKTPDGKDPLMQCMDDRLTPYLMQNFEFDANIRHMPPLPEENNFLPYVGNGYIGLAITPDSVLNIKYGRSIQMATQFQPIISVNQNEGAAREATVVEYLNGIVHRFQCFQNYFVSYTYYAHRAHPSILMQQIKITNTRNSVEDVTLILPRVKFDKPQTRTVSLEFEKNKDTYNLKDFDVTTGTVSAKPHDPDSFVVITIVKPQIPTVFQLKKRGTMSIEFPIAVHYSHAQKLNQNMPLQKVILDTENKALQAMTKIMQKFSNKSPDAFKQEHVNVWNELWATGLSISTSKAENSLNGERINATMYAVLSQVRSYEFEEYVSVSAPSQQEIAKILTYAEGCYDSYHTLQAENLWRDMHNMDELNNLVASWMLTLDKQGCHNLILAGASGVIQAMVLSFGSFRFSNQHLQCNMHPKYLHRDFHFRRLNYGNRTHVNVTINVTDDNKAVINVALDRSDRSYYACDGGCLDEPILLSQNRHQFPVKLTEPLTAILYITEDKVHIEELHHAIHVKEVVEAPAHEQHVIALHKHGHQLGALPTLFWVSICAIIVMFHVFLCKLIIKEYCEPSDKSRYHRYNKP